MYRKKLIFIAGLLMFSFARSNAQEVKTLQEVLSFGLENNYSIRMARKGQEISDNNFSRGNAGFFPSLDLRTQYSGTRNNTDRDNIDGTTSSMRGVHNTVASVNLNLGWTIFDGFRVQTSYDRLGVLQEMGELNTQQAIENLIANLSAEYFNLIRQKQQLENLKFAVELSRERMRIDEERYLLGSGSRLQLLQAEVFLNADSARMTRQEEVVRASRIRLNELMAREDLRAGIQPSDTIIPLEDILILESLRRSAEENNTSLRAAAKNTTLSEYDQKMIAAGTYPFVSLSSGYGLSRNTYQTGSFTDQQTAGMNYGITLGMNLFDGFNQRRRMSNARIEVENSRVREEDTRNTLMADLITNYEEYLNFFRLIEMESHNLDVAYETLNIALERYRLGELSGIELREVQKNLLEAEERLLTVQYQAKLAEISLKYIAGRITDYL